LRFNCALPFLISVAFRTVCGLSVVCLWFVSAVHLDVGLEDPIGTSPSELWDALDKNLMRAKRSVDEFWIRKVCPCACGFNISIMTVALHALTLDLMHWTVACGLWLVAHGLWLAQVRTQQQEVTRLQELVRSAEDRAQDAERRLAEEQDNNAVSKHAQQVLQKHLSTFHISFWPLVVGLIVNSCFLFVLFVQKLWDKITQIQKQLQKLTRPLIKL
jgi:hypothetical protein